MRCGIEMSEMFMKHHKKVVTQQGVALVVALVFLLVMTVVGVSSYVNTTLQERMVSSARQADLAKQAAIAAVQVAERTLSNSMGQFLERYRLFSTASSCTGLYQPFPIRDGSQPMLAAKTIAFDVNDDTAWGSANSLEANNVLSVGSVSQNPRYIIEIIGFGAPDGDVNSLIQDGGGGGQQDRSEFAVYFRITAIGWAQDENISSLVQSTVRMTLVRGSPSAAACPT